MRKAKWLVRGVLLLAGAGMVGGCESATGSGALIGGATGAGVGGLIGSVSHARAGEGALIGGAIGAASGALIGNSIDQQEREQYPREPQRYERARYDDTYYEPAPPPPPPPPVVYREEVRYVPYYGYCPPPRRVRVYGYHRGYYDRY